MPGHHYFKGQVVFFFCENPIQKRVLIRKILSGSVCVCVCVCVGGGGGGGGGKSLKYLSLPPL